MPQFKANAIRTLGTIVDSSLISGVERVMKQAIGDKSPYVASAALVTAVHFFGENREAVKRWLPEVQAAFQAGHGKTIAQYHTLGLLYLIKQNDRMALSKLVQQIQGQPTNMLATCLNLRIYGSLLAVERSANAQVMDLKPFLRLKGRSDMVSLEAAKIICEHHDLYAADVVFAISTLQMFLASSRPLLRFAAIRTLNEFASVARDQVAVCNVEIESLVSDANRNVATLAITTLLKTGNEASVDRLISQISGYVSEISDEFKIIVVDAVRSLGLKFPSKHKSMLQFLGNVLREEGGLEYKQLTVDTICDLLAAIPEARDTALSHLCEFIEDCEYPQLTAQILHLLGEEGAKIDNPAKIIRYIYNRLILEGPTVRVAAVGALTRLAASRPFLKDGVRSILGRCVEDEDDQVRDRAVIGLSGLEDEQVATEFFSAAEVFDLETLESQLMDYLQQSQAALALNPFDMSQVPMLASKDIFERSRRAVSLLGAGIDEAPSTKGQSLAVGEDQIVPLGPNRVAEIPQFAQFGPILSSTSPIGLTDPDAEYVIHACKYFYQSSLVVEFECRNTVREIMLEDVQVQIHVESEEPSWQPLFGIPIAKLRYDDPACCYAAFGVDIAKHPEARLACSLRFTAFEVDPESETPLGRGLTEEYPIDALEIGFGDYVRYRDVTDFTAEWDGMPHELLETLQLPSMHSIGEAVRAVCNVVGCRPLAGSDQVDPNASLHTVLFSGTLIGTKEAAGEMEFLIRARFALRNDGVVMEVCVRSMDAQASESILSAIC